MSQRPTIMLVVPWLEIGGADAIGFQIIEALHDEFDFGVVTTLAGDHPLEEQVARQAVWVEHAARQTSEPTPAFLKSLVEQHNVRGVLVNWCAAGYEALPELKSIAHNIWTADIVHNTAPEAWIRHSVLFDLFIDRHFAVGPAQADELIKFASIDPNKVTLAHNGVDVETRFNSVTYAHELPELRREFAVTEDETVLTFIGRLSPEKACPLFVRAVLEIIRRNPDRKIRALIAGDGPDRDQVEQEIAERRLTNHCHILGLTDRIPHLLAVSDHLLLTSETEGSPLVLLEAMAMGVVPIAADVGTVADVISDGRNGKLTGARTPDAFADAFTRIPEDYADLSSNARRTVVDRFNQNQMIETYAATLRSAFS